MYKQTHYLKPLLTINIGLHLPEFSSWEFLSSTAWRRSSMMKPGSTALLDDFAKHLQNSWTNLYLNMVWIPNNRPFTEPIWSSSDSDGIRKDSVLWQQTRWNRPLVHPLWCVINFRPSRIKEYLEHQSHLLAPLSKQALDFACSQCTYTGQGPVATEEYIKLDAEVIYSYSLLGVTVA